MPNRIIKESICTSEKVASLTDFEFRLWIGLLTQVDDAGRGDARPAIIKGHVFPLRERVSTKDIDAALHGLAAKGCVSLYTVGGKPYFWFPTWSKHQRIRECKPKFPAPEESDENNADYDNSPQPAATCGNSPQPAALIQSNPNTNPNTNTSKSNARARTFIPPSFEEVEEYAKTRGNLVDTKRFFDYFSAANWHDSTGKPVKNWKQKMITWEGRNLEHGTRPKKSDDTEGPGTTAGKWNIRYDVNGDESQNAQ